MSNVKVVKFFNKKYCVKKIEVPFSYREIISQHKFINYLYKNGINTPKIKFNYFLSIFNIELQEYIGISSKKINTSSLISFLAKFHSVSKLYTQKFYKKDFYNTNFKCNDVKLEKLLLGFQDKYYYGPFLNYKKNQIYLENNKNIEIVTKKYYSIYKIFMEKYYKEDCIIHNDITSNNIINNEKIYIIDFDLAITSSVYVDFVDAILKRSQTLDQILILINNKQQIEKYIFEYNNVSKYNQLEYNGVILMICLKICAYNYYVVLQKHQIKTFEINIKKILKILNLVERNLEI